MAQNRLLAILLGVCAAVLVFAALYLARAILAPVAFALFVIAIAWPLQRELQTRIPKLLALVVTLLAVLVVLTLFVSLIVWGFGRIGQWIIDNAAKFQMFYVHVTTWLEGHGFAVANQIAESFNMSWLIRAAQQIGGRAQGLVSFIIIAFAFTVLGLLEVDITQRNLARIEGSGKGQPLSRAGADIAAKFQKYMLVRTIMSVLTGALIWAVTLLAGLELATAWGVIAFVLNYIPFIGPLIATVFPTLFAIAQFESLQLALIIFVCLNVIQFLVGSYLEPRMAGAALSLSPFLVLFAVFFWTFLWGIPGAFIGVPIVIAALTVCAEYESTRWVAILLSGREAGKIG
jgi:predicted PurR-regulated permease PerM